ncbi:hypothetical protein BJ508DRAFT_300726 [Ascobolus immersus RN42]|uniref:Uncharacterized protein n=1 Tax=Ascobolus immersus RN42 TaxID=1160509 RepID=A0A3N4IPV4_ASCIM|nr:hypothetical protein BJ508DRAFT_300726 [Ascobolus immersus RN42]
MASARLYQFNSESLATSKRQRDALFISRPWASCAVGCIITGNGIRSWSHCFPYVSTWSLARLTKTASPELSTSPPAANVSISETAALRITPDMSDVLPFGSPMFQLSHTPYELPTMGIDPAYFSWHRMSAGIIATASALFTPPDEAWWDNSQGTNIDLTFAVQMATAGNAGPHGEAFISSLLLPLQGWTSVIFIPDWWDQIGVMIHCPGGETTLIFVQSNHWPLKSLACSHYALELVCNTVVEKYDVTLADAYTYTAYTLFSMLNASCLILTYLFLKAHFRTRHTSSAAAARSATRSNFELGELKPPFPESALVASSHRIIASEICMNDPSSALGPWPQPTIHERTIHTRSGCTGDEFLCLLSWLIPFARWFEHRSENTFIIICNYVLLFSTSHGNGLTPEEPRPTIRKMHYILHFLMQKTFICYQIERNFVEYFVLQFILTASRALSRRYSRARV